MKSTNAFFTAYLPAQRREVAAGGESEIGVDEERREGKGVEEQEERHDPGEGPVHEVCPLVQRSPG